MATSLDKTKQDSQPNLQSSGLSSFIALPNQLSATSKRGGESAESSYFIIGKNNASNEK